MWEQEISWNKKQSRLNSSHVRLWKFRSNLSSTLCSRQSTVLSTHTFLTANISQVEGSLATPTSTTDQIVDFTSLNVWDFNYTWSLGLIWRVIAAFIKNTNNQTVNRIRPRPSVVLILRRTEGHTKVTVTLFENIKISLISYQSNTGHKGAVRWWWVLNVTPTEVGTVVAEWLTTRT